MSQEKQYLLAEKTELQRMLANTLESSVIDRMSLEARKQKVEKKLDEISNTHLEKQQKKIEFNRIFAMPNKNTFSIKPIKEFVEKYTKDKKLIVDPFCGNSNYAHFSNDLNPNINAQYHLTADKFLEKIKEKNIISDLILLDPPYSPRQINECYKISGIKTNIQTTQNGKLMKTIKSQIESITDINSIVLSFGWNSIGMGKHWDILEIMLVYHGGAHNDTICMAQIKK